MMRIEEPLDFVGNAIFCDDIRQEVDQKASYIGVYSAGTMIVNGAFPVTLSKLGIALTFAQRRELFVPNIGIRIFLPGDTDEKASIEAEAAPGAAMPALDEDMPMVMIVAQLLLSPLVISQPGAIRVRVLREGLLHRLGVLQVKALSEASGSPS
jgi:hypothetical protein